MPDVPVRKKFKIQSRVLSSVDPIAIAAIRDADGRCPTTVMSTKDINGVVMLVSKAGHARAKICRESPPVL